jgi:hypothetical protein
MRVLKHVELEPAEDGLGFATRFYGETDIQMDRGLRESIRVSGDERRPYRTDESEPYAALRAVFIYLLKDRRMMTILILIFFGLVEFWTLRIR